MVYGCGRTRQGIAAATAVFEATDEGRALKEFEVAEDFKHLATSHQLKKRVFAMKEYNFPAGILRMEARTKAAAEKWRNKKAEILRERSAGILRCMAAMHGGLDPSAGAPVPKMFAQVADSRRPYSFWALQANDMKGLGGDRSLSVNQWIDGKLSQPPPPQQRPHTVHAPDGPPRPAASRHSQLAKLAHTSPRPAKGRGAGKEEEAMLEDCSPMGLNLNMVQIKSARGAYNSGDAWRARGAGGSMAEAERASTRGSMRVSNPVRALEGNSGKIENYSFPANALGQPRGAAKLMVTSAASASAMSVTHLRQMSFEAEPRFGADKAGAAAGTGGAATGALAFEDHDHSAAQTGSASGLASHAAGGGKGKETVTVAASGQGEGWAVHALAALSDEGRASLDPVAPSWSYSPSPRGAVSPSPRTALSSAARNLHVHVPAPLQLPHTARAPHSPQSEASGSVTDRAVSCGRERADWDLPAHAHPLVCMRGVCACVKWCIRTCLSASTIWCVCV